MTNRNRHVIKQSLLDVCILTAGKIDLFQKALAAAIQQTIDFDCSYYVLDNGSPREKQAEYLSIMEEYPQVEYKRLNDNVGFPAGANKLIKLGNSPLILFVSDDVILHDGSVDALVRRMDDKTVALCGLKLLFPADSNDRIRPAGKVQHIGHAINIRSEVIHPLIGWDADNPKCNVSRAILSVTGAAFMVRRKPFLQAGGFFEGYGKGTYEDIDLCTTLRGMGYKVWIETKAIGTHYVGATVQLRGEGFALQQNGQLFVSRHGSELQWDEYLAW